VRTVLTVSACAMWLVLLAWADVSPVMSQDKPSASKALDPRLESLIGTWEGRVRLATSKSDESRTLIVQEKDGQLGVRYGITGKRLDPVDLTVDAGGARLKVSFRTGPGNTVNLELARDDWLMGAFSLTGGGRGGGSQDRPMDLEKKK
jgi:hypothetical protein